MESLWHTAAMLAADHWFIAICAFVLVLRQIALWAVNAADRRAALAAHITRRLNGGPS